MKKIIFTLLGLLMITSASAASQTTFMPVLSEGKSWEVTTISWDYENFPNSNDTTGYYAVSVCGDTIVNNLTCKKIEIVPKGNQKSSKTAVAYEKDGKVWNVNSNGEMVLIFDIGLHQYDEVDAGYVVKEDYISVNGFNRKRLLIDSGIDSDDYSYYVVEGIGISSDKWVSKLGIGNENEYTIMLSCSENGEIVFTKEDFSKQDDYVPLVREGVKWVEYYNNSIENIESLTSYQFDGQKEIGGNIYSMLYAANINDATQNNRLVAYVREQDKQIYIIPVDSEVYGCIISNEDINEYKIYDFNDITSPYTLEEIFLTPVSSEQMQLGDNLVNLYNIGNTKRIAEGVGCLDNVFYDPWPMAMPDGSHTSLAWFEDNGEILFKGEDYEAAVDYLSDYVPLVREGVVWEYVGCRQYSHQHSLYALEFNGTTTIDGKLYHKIYRTDYDKQGNAQEPYFVAYVREENKIVSVYIDTYEQDEDFYYTYWWDIPKTLYDFSKPMFLPDEAYIIFGNDGPIDYNTNYYPSSSIEVEVGETTRKGYFIDHGNDDESFKTIEGIGVDCDFGDLLIPYRTFYTGFNPMASLAAVYENGELVYKGRAYDKAQRLKYPVVGDADDDGVVTSADITALYNYLLDSDYQYYETSDVDGDGSVTSADITAVYNIMLGNGN